LLHGGLGSAVAMSAARQCPVAMRFVAIKDTFAESGTPEGLLAKYGLTAGDIVREALALAGK
jgi:transketolase